MKSNEKVAELIGKLPGADSRSVKDKEARAEMERILAALLEGGRDRIIAVVGMLDGAGKDEDARARYALHALATHVCQDVGRAKRPMFGEALASTLGGDRSKEIQAFVIRQLQVAGGKESAPALGKQLADADLCEPAAQALLAIRHGAAEQFRAALAKVSGKQRLTVVQALGVLRDEPSAVLLRKFIADADRNTRLAALWAVANIGDADAVEAVLKAGDVKESHERIKATQACLLLAERLRAAGKKREAARIYTHLKDTRTDAGEKYVRDAAVKALSAEK